MKKTLIWACSARRSPTHGVYFMNMCSNGWGPNFDNTKALMKKLGIDRPYFRRKNAHCPLWQRILVPRKSIGSAV